MAKARWLTFVSAAALLGALGFVVAGCGSSSAAPPATTSTTTPTGGSGGSGATARNPAFEAAFQAYRSCLQSHGVAIPRFNGRRPARGPSSTNPTSTNRFPRPGGSGGSGGFFGRFGANLTTKQRAAIQACRSKLPANGRLGGRGGFRSGGGNGRPSSGAFAKYTQCLAKHGVKFGSAGQNPTTFAKAQTACRSLLRPAARPPTATTTAATS